MKAAPCLTCEHRYESKTFHPQCIGCQKARKYADSQHNHYFNTYPDCTGSEIYNLPIDDRGKWKRPPRLNDDED